MIRKRLWMLTAEFPPLAYRNAKSNRRPGPLLRLQFHPPIDRFHSLPDAEKPEFVATGLHDGGRIAAQSMILHHDLELAEAVVSHAHSGVFGTGVLQDVEQQFSHALVQQRRLVFRERRSHGRNIHTDVEALLQHALSK